MTDNAPGWQTDPTGRHEHRYWDGSAWTDNVSDAGVASTDAYAAAGSPAADVPEPAAPTTPTPTAPAAPAPDAVPTWADPTTTTAAAASVDPTSTWPTSPAPPAPPSYTPPAPLAGGPGGPSGSEGSKKGLFIGIGVLAAVAIVVAVLLMGGGDDKGDGNIRTQLAAQFKANSELSGSQADCVADHVVDEMGADSFKDVDFTADEPPEDIAEELFAAAASSLEACDIDPADFAGTDGSTDGGTDGGDGTYGSDEELDALYDDCKAGDYQACDDLYNQSPSGSEYEDFADTCGDRNEPSGYCVDIYEDDGGDDGVATDGDLPAGFEQQLADIYESSLGLSKDQAECLAGKLAHAVSSGDLSEEEAFSDVFNFLADCDIDPSEISGN